MSKTIYLPKIEPSRGLYIDEMLTLANEVPINNWEMVSPKYAEEIVFVQNTTNREFTYKYHVTSKDLAFYLTDDLGIFRRKGALKILKKDTLKQGLSVGLLMEDILKQDTPVGYSGKILLRKYPTFRDLCDKVFKYLWMSERERLDAEFKAEDLEERRKLKEEIKERREAIKDIRKNLLK